MSNLNTLPAWSCSGDPLGRSARNALPDPRFLGALGKLVDEFALYRHVVRIATAADDDAQLEGARPVLERLGDCRHLGKLEEVEVVN